MRFLSSALLFLAFSAAGLTYAAAPAPYGDTRAVSLIDADHFTLRLPQIQSKSQWETRRAVIREQVLLRAGLWPEPPRTPLNARVFDEVRGDGFTVAKVYFESLPGFYGTGNLYRPTKGTAPYPAIITPHGHWPNGRLVNVEDCSIPGRCIDFARMGFVVLAIDMIGFGDSMQFPHVSYMYPVPVKADIPLPMDKRNFTADFNFPEAELYGFSLGALQLWNNIRGVDFLCSLPEVDKNRIGATGASGGATQTILLMTADDRIRCAAPVNIVGAAKHPGCRCENFRGLWLDTTTLELCAAFAPKPLLLMSATEDPWTNRAPEREYPMIKKYYDLYNAGDMLKNVHITAGHNYNADTRAAVYSWFCAHLRSEFPAIAKPAVICAEAKSLGDLRVFPDRMLPEGAKSAPEIIADWKGMSGQAYEAMLPVSRADWDGFAKTFRQKLAFALSVEVPASADITWRDLRAGSTGKAARLTLETGVLGRKGRGDAVALETLAQGGAEKCVLLVAPERSGDSDPKSSPGKEWRATGYRVYRVHGYASGELSIPKKTFDSFTWSAAYNRDNGQNAIQDIITAIEYIRRDHPRATLRVVGLGECGLTTALACAVSGHADEVVADLNGTDPGYDGELLALLPCSGIRRVGDFRTAALLLMNKPLTLLNAGATFDRGWYEKMAKTMGMERNLEVR